MFDWSQPIPVAALLTPAMILIVGLSQAGVVAVGIWFMRRAARDRNKQIDAMAKALQDMGQGLLDMGGTLNESARGIRELLEVRTKP